MLLVAGAADPREHLLLNEPLHCPCGGSFLVCKDSDDCISFRLLYYDF